MQTFLRLFFVRFRMGSRQNKELDHFRDSKKSGSDLEVVADCTFESLGIAITTYNKAEVVARDLGLRDARPAKSPAPRKTPVSNGSVLRGIEADLRG